MSRNTKKAVLYFLSVLTVGKNLAFKSTRQKQPTHPNMAISLFSKMHIATDSNYLFFAGDNIIGRRSKGTNIHVPIESSDTTMERQHCIINISVNKQGKTIYTLRDFPSTSGTFLKHELLNKRERVILENGSIVTIGATTFIVYFSEEEQTYTD